MDVLYIASQMVMLSLPIALGYAVHKAGIMNDEVDHNLSRIVLEVALPCLIIASVGSVDELPDARTIAVVLAASALANLLVLVVGFAATAAMRAPADVAGAYRYMIAFGNCSFMGFPVVSAVLGGQAVLLL
ncbi:AEC family transporter, partial [Enorma burkinafasonensis]|uniref:AEC family transporter n=1 Tax=Enorma burkinafasonensis TaxID=2590867 RepID=UPI0026F05EFF